MTAGKIYLLGGNRYRSAVRLSLWIFFIHFLSIKIVKICLKNYQITSLLVKEYG